MRGPVLLPRLRRLFRTMNHCLWQHQNPHQNLIQTKLRSNPIPVNNYCSAITNKCSHGKSIKDRLHNEHLRRLHSATIDGTFKIAKRKNRRFDYSFKLNNREQGFIKYRKRLSGLEITIDTNKNMILDKKSDLLLTQSSWESSFNTMPPWRQLKKAIGQRGEVQLTLMANDEPVINRRSLRNYRDNGYRRIILK